MKGIDLSRKYYEEYGKEMISKEFSEIENYIAIGLTGSGSECYGFDDELSTDHDFGPGFCIFLPSEDTIDRQIAFKLERAYSKLPQEFMGYKNSKIMPAGGSRTGVIYIDKFFMQTIGYKDGELNNLQWLTIPTYDLAEAVNGDIFIDNYGLISTIRSKLNNMPEDVRRKKLASNLMKMSGSGQYNYLRCIKREETAAAQLACYKFVISTMEVIFLLNKKYMPFYKWSFRALRELNILSSLSASLEYLISTSNDSDNISDKLFIIDDICNTVIEELQNQELTMVTCNNLDKHAISVNDHIKDNNLRNLNIIIG